MLSFEQLRDLYNTADIFLFPSTHEGFANVVLEAAACGLPILGLNRTSMPEFVTDGNEGFLAENYQELKIRLEHLIENEDLRKQMGRNARKRAEEFRWDRIAEQYAEVFRSLVN